MHKHFYSLLALLCLCCGLSAYAEQVEMPAVSIIAGTGYDEDSTDQLITFYWSGYSLATIGADATASVYKDDATEPLFTLDASAFERVSSYSVSLHLPEPLTESGAYRVDVAADALNLMQGRNSYTNAAFSFVYDFTVAEPTIGFTAVPADGSEILATEGINQIQVAFDGYRAAKTQPTGVKLTIALNGETIFEGLPSMVSRSFDAKNVAIVLSQQYTTLGNYVISFPAGMFTLVDPNTEEEVPSPAIELNYTVVAAQSSTELLSFTANPAPGVVSSLDQVVLTFNKPIKSIAASGNNIVDLFCSSSYPVYDYESHYTISDDGLQMTITLPQTLDWGGIWALQMFGNDDRIEIVDGETWNGFSITYVINDKPIPSTAKPAYASELSSIEEVTIIFPYMRNSDKNAIVLLPEAEAYFTDGTDRVAATCTQVIPYDFEYGARATYLPAQPIIKAGDWSLVIEANSLQFTNLGATMNNPTMSTPTWTIKGGYSATLTPASGATISRFDNFTVDFTGGESYEIDADKTATFVINTKSWFGEMPFKTFNLVPTASLTDEGVVLRLAVPDEQEVFDVIDELDSSKTYTYVLNIPAGFITINDLAWDGTKATYNYEAPQWLILPYSESTLESFERITVRCNATTNYTAVKHEIPVTYNGKAYAETASLTEVDGVANRWVITMPESATAPGKWTLNLDGVFKAQGALKPLAMGNIYYTIAGYVAPEFTFSPESGEVKEVSEITIEAYAGAPVTLNAESVQVTKDGEAYGVATVTNITADESGKQTWTLTLEPAITDEVSGAYTVHIDALFADAEGDLALENLLYTVVSTGIEALVEDVAAGAEYYTLQGVKVSKPVAGLYIRICNGLATKVLVK